TGGGIPPMGLNPCGDPFGGGCGGGGSGDDGYEYPEPPTNTPCEKMKTQNADQRYKDKISELDNDSIFIKKKETGFAAAYGPQINYEPITNITNDKLKMPEGNKYFGYIHSHINKEGVIKIFSPGDLGTFLTRCVRNAQEKGTMSDAYAMVITSQGNYILKYSGDGSYNIGPNQLSNWKTWYNDIFEELSRTDALTQANVEKAFTQFLEKVSINGLQVYKSDKTTGSPSMLTYNGKDNPVQSTPCP
ncbi:hypothetical protein LPB90_20215, partial [Chryseobacterium sp. LC2016-29]|uniref:hypothetical protein n=1 Tax=Chryseobacterium sp. LC2016-29 TaxID=2897331 RepID=UPI001E4041B5